MTELSLFLRWGLTVKLWLVWSETREVDQVDLELTEILLLLPHAVISKICLVPSAYNRTAHKLGSTYRSLQGSKATLRTKGDPRGDSLGYRRNVS